MLSNMIIEGHLLLMRGVEKQNPSILQRTNVQEVIIKMPTGDFQKELQKVDMELLEIFTLGI